MQDHMLFNHVMDKIKKKNINNNRHEPDEVLKVKIIND